MTEQNNSMSGSSRLKVPSHLTYRNQSEEVAMQSRSNCRMEKSLTSTAKQFQESQQQNERLSTMETSSCSSPDSSECFILEDEKGSTPIMEIDNQKEPQSCSDKSITVPQNFYKDVMYELVKLRQELEAERGKTHILESKISRQSQKIKNLKVKTHSKQDTLKTPPIRLKIEAVTKGKYISSLDDSDSSSACSPNYSGDDAEEIEPELYDESPTEDAALSPNGLRLQTSTLNSRTNVNKTQIPATNCERKQLSGRQGSKEKSLKKHNLPAFDDPVSCAKNKPTDNSLRKRKVRQGQLQTNSENSVKRMKNSSVVGAFSSSSEIKSTEGVKAGILDTGIKPQQQTESTTYTKEVEIVDERTGFILKGTECISVTEDLSVEDTLFDTARRSFNELFSEITQDGVNSKTNGHIDQPYSDNGNHCFSRNATTDSNVSRNPDKQRQISERRSTKKLTKLVKRDGYLLPSSNLVPVGERHTLHESGSYKHAEHEANKIAGRNEHVRNQLNVGFVDDDCIPSETWSRNQGFTEIGSCNKIKTLKTSGDLLHQSCSVLVNKNHSLHEPRLRDCETWSQVTELKISNNLKQKFAEMSKCNSNPLSINCTKEDGVLSTMSSRTKSITPVCKTKNPNKSSLDYSYGCNLCGLKFCGMESLHCHIPCVGSVTNKDPLKCGVCSKTFRESVVLERHLQGLASNKLLECEICSKICASKSCLAFHMKIHIDIGSEKCLNQSNTLLPKESQASQRSSECTVCNKRFFSKQCLQSHLKQHQENERKLPSRASVDCHPENLVMLEKRSDSKEPRNRSFQDALNMNRLLTTDLVSNQAVSQEQNSAQHCDRERSSWSIFNQDRLLCDSGNSLPIDHNQDKTNHQQNLTSVSIFDRMSSKIPSCQRESMELICAQEIGSNIRKTYRPYCVKCWDTFTDLQALEEHAKVCKEFSRESSPRETIPIRINDCIVTKSEDWLQSSECVMENGSEEKALQSFEAVADNYQSVDVAKSNTFQELGINSNMSVTSKVHDCVDEDAKYGIDEVANCQSHDWAKNSLEGVARREPNDRASMLHVLAKNAADDLANSESDDLQESFSDDIANIESYLANSESHIIDLNVSGKLANGKLDDLAEHLSDDLRKNGSDELVEDGSTQMTRSVSCKVTKDPRSKLISSGSHEFLTSGLTDLSKLRSHGVTKNSSHTVNFVKSEVSNCSSDDALHCLDCRKIFSCHQKLKKHLELHKLFGTSLHGSRCKQKFTVLDSKQEHTCQAYSIMGPQFRCPECHESFKISQRFKKHMSEVHSMDQHFKCKQCGKQYDRFCKWNEHVQAHRTDRHYVCNKCGKRFKHLHHLKSGHLPCLSDYTELKCPKCNNVFEQASRLRRHLTFCQNARAVKCLVCHRLFLNQLKLDKHMGCHTDEKPYLCLQCDECFIFREDLIRHVHDHSVETSYVCVVCNKAFAGKASLLTHLKIHTTKIESCLGNCETPLMDVNGSGKSGDLAERLSDDLGKVVSGELIEDGSRQMNKTVSCKVAINKPNKLISSGSHEFLKGDLTDSTKSRSKVVTKNSSQVVNFAKSESQKLTKNMLYEASNCSSKDVLQCLDCHKIFSGHQKLNKHIELHRLFGSSLHCSRCKQEFTVLDSIQEHTCQAYSIIGPQFKCPECHESFKISQRLKKHMSEIHSIEQNFKCKQCGKQYEMFYKWNNHVQAHRTDRRYVCNMCGKRFKHLHHLKSDHLPCLSNSAELKCPKCNHVFERASELRRHVRLCKNDRAVKCLVCHRLFHNQLKLDKHLGSHTDEKPYLCLQCDERFIFREDLLSHVHRHSDEKSYVCVVCDKAFGGKASLLSHLKIHTISWKNCSLGSKISGMSSDVEMKGVEKQTAKRFYGCGLCGCLYIGMVSLKRHLPCEGGASEDPFFCGDCNEKFVDANELEKHVLGVHSKNFICSICSKMFVKKLYLKQHIMDSHTDEKPYKCKQCGREFKHSLQLRYHLPCYVSPGSDIQCNLCPMTFCKISQLRTHISINHNSKAVQCDVCAKILRDRQALDVHLKIHANNRRKPYSCTHCSKSFFHTSSLRRHIETVHLDPLKCDAEIKNVNCTYQSHNSPSTAGTDDTLCCLNCFKTFSSHQELNKHMEQHKQFGSSLRCSRCKQKFSLLDSIQGHTCQAYTIEGPQFRCPECEECFEISWQLKNHVSEVHSMEQHFKCKHCGKQYDKFCQWNSHVQAHRTDRRYVCNKCGKSFKHLHHLRSDHLPCLSNSAALKCPKCSQGFARASRLRRHVRLCQNEPAVKCLVCHQVFNNQSKLDEHKCCHTNEKPYRCLHCDMCFSRREDLLSHAAGLHSAEDDLSQTYVCDVCGKSFSAKTAFQKHLKSHMYVNGKCSLGIKVIGASNKVQCDVCGKTFPSNHVLDIHLKSHANESKNDRKKPYSCRQCSKCFVHSSSLSRHLETTHLDTLKCDDANNNFHSKYQYDAYSITGPQFRCPECEESFEISQKLKKHMSEVHSVEQHFKCKRCGKQYEKFCQWNSHVQAHRTDRHYVCKKCGKKYKYLHHLKRDHLPCLSDSTELKCPKCNEVFRKATQLRYHLTLCQNVRAVKCQVCQRLFHNQKKLDKHMRCHTGEKPYQCPQCDKCFSFRVNLATHIQRHSDVRPYVCDVCGKAFATETFLRNHSRIHTTDRPYKCNECDKSFLYECLLRNHKSKIHKGVKKRFACGICNKTFCSKMYLNTHMCSHTGQNPFLCSICGKGFPAKILLKYHLRVHTGEKPYACKYCYRRFSMPRSMRNHERVHTGEKPYECTICGMKFPQSNYLKNHSKKAHTAE